jgi:hypothetical protein
MRMRREGEVGADVVNSASQYSCAPEAYRLIKSPYSNRPVKPLKLFTLPADGGVCLGASRKSKIL